MKKLLPVLIGIVSFISCSAEINIWASAVYLTVNGTPGFYNARQPLPGYAIGNNNFDNSVGVFGKNSGNLKITGAEINVFSSAAAVCETNIFYIVYRKGERPAQPVFTPFVLQPYCKCNGRSFEGCGGKACDNINDQKFQDAGQSVDLTLLETGTYTMELYFTATGGAGCAEQDTDDNNGDNYKADFIITAPLAVNLLSFHAFAADDDIRIRWTVENDEEVFHYEIEKSLNGLYFWPLDSIASLQSPAGSTYYYSDARPVIGSNYYRIRLYKQNGVVTLSNVFRIYYGRVANTVLIYPNPVSDVLNMRLAGIQKGNYKMSVLGTNGQVIRTQPLYHDGIDKTIRVALPPGMQRGIYWLFLIDKYHFFKQPFTVK